MTKIIVCRCEDVLLSDLEDAIEGGNQDVESLKRYTGFGTGVCQGKSCVAHVGAILAAQLESKAVPIMPFTPRPPVSPIPMRLLAAKDDTTVVSLRGPRGRHKGPADGAK